METGSAKRLPRGLISVSEFVLYSSPRYFRLIFPNLKPRTKNGDLVAALNELRRARILTGGSHWDGIFLTEKGHAFKTLIAHLLDSGALNVPQSSGLFDYRSEGGRRAILELLQFFSAKLNINMYFNYLHVPLFGSKENPEWINLFGEDSRKIEYESSEGRDQLLTYLQHRSRPHRKKTLQVHQQLSHKDIPISFTLNLIKRFLQKRRLKRPEPLFSHLNLCNPQVFTIYERRFNVILAELTRLTDIFQTFITDFQTDENRWLSDYFQLLQLPSGKTQLFGFMTSPEVEYASKTDPFLKIAVEGPRIFAGQFSSIEGLGDLTTIIFPINPTESLVIVCGNLDLLYYFTIESKFCTFSITSNLISISGFPEKFLSNRGEFGKEFGKLLFRSRTLEEALTFQDLCNAPDSTTRKNCADTLRTTKSALEEQVEYLSYMSASLISICQMITQKYNAGYRLTKCLCFYRGGYLNLVDLGGKDRILTSTTLGNITFGPMIRKTMKKIEQSLLEIIPSP